MAYSKYSNFTRRGSCDRNITLTVNLYEDALPRGKLTTINRDVCVINYN